MSDYYGKAVFTDGAELFLVYATSPGYALTALFNSVEEASAWKDQDCTTLERTEYQAIERSKVSEESVHILIDINSPEKPSMWFYSTASRQDMVITGPTSSENAEYENEYAGGVYTKEFFDSWSDATAPKSPRTQKFSRPQDDSPEP